MKPSVKKRHTHIGVEGAVGGEGVFEGAVVGAVG